MHNDRSANTSSVVRARVHGHSADSGCTDLGYDTRTPRGGHKENFTILETQTSTQELGGLIRGQGL